MQFTLREMKRYRAPLLIWLTGSAVAGVAGPFGTLEAMGLPARMGYWAGVIGLSTVLSMITNEVARRFGRIGHIAVWAGFVLLLAGVLHGINSLAFTVWGDVWDWVYMTATVALVTSAVQLIIWGVGGASGPTTAETEQDDFFQARLPIELRGNVVRIEAQDHYLNVVTSRGSTLILMRLSDAITEVQGRGLQVHRSHWIAVDSVRSHRREKGRDFLVMEDGADIPVSRSFRTAVQQAGLF